MRTTCLAAVCVLAAWMVSAEAQTSQAPATFAGKWTLDVSTFVGTDGPGPDTITLAGDRVPRKTRDVPPKFPAEARKKRIAGSIELLALLDARGEVADVRVVRSIPLFDRAAIDAVWQWTYPPYVWNNAPAEVWVTVLVNFTGNGFDQVENALVKQVPVGFGTGMWHGHVPASLDISQDARKLTIMRPSAAGANKLTYRLDGKPCQNKLPMVGSAKDDAYTYTSRWDGVQLVTGISWIGPNGPRSITETIARDGDTLRVTTTRVNQTSGKVAIRQVAVYTRR